MPLEVDNAMSVENISMDDIFSDQDFNIRGGIHMGDVVELAKNIETRGLLQAIAIQPYNKDGFKWRIVLGHRRYAAFQHLKRKTIPAIIKYGMSEIDALIANFSENINRKDLNILEEAYGVDRLGQKGMTVEQIAKNINKGRNWVRIRQALLKMPPAIQQDAAANFITQGQIFDLSSVNDPDEQMAIVHRIKEAKLNGERRLPIVKDKKRNLIRSKRRSPEEMFDMIDHLITETGQGSIITRTLAWTAGEITDLDFYRDIIAFHTEHDIPYDPPEEVREYIRIKTPADFELERIMKKLKESGKG